MFSTITEQASNLRILSWLLPAGHQLQAARDWGSPSHALTRGRQLPGAPGRHATSLPSRRPPGSALWLRPAARLPSGLPPTGTRPCHPACVCGTGALRLPPARLPPHRTPGGAGTLWGTLWCPSPRAHLLPSGSGWPRLLTRVARPNECMRALQYCVRCCCIPLPHCFPFLPSFSCCCVRRATLFLKDRERGERELYFRFQHISLCRAMQHLDWCAYIQESL